MVLVIKSVKQLTVRENKSANENYGRIIAVILMKGKQKWFAYAVKLIWENLLKQIKGRSDDIICKNRCIRGKVQN